MKPKTIMKHIENVSRYVPGLSHKNHNQHPKPVRSVFKEKHLLAVVLFCVWCAYLVYPGFIEDLVNGNLVHEKLLSPNLGWIALPTLLYAITLYVLELRRRSEIKHLKQSGKIIKGHVTEVLKYGQGTSHAKFVVIPDSHTAGETSYMSDPLTNSLDMVIAYQGKSLPINIFVNSSNSKRYFVDIDNFPLEESKTTIQRTHV